MISVVAVVGCVLLAALAVFQLLLIAGMPWGRLAWGGQHVVLPARFRAGSAVSIVIYALVAVLFLCVAGLLSLLPRGFVEVAIWVLVGYFALGILLNAISRSRPERLVMTPTVAALTGISLALALA